MPTSRKRLSSGFATPSTEDSEKVLNISFDETMLEETKEEEVVEPQDTIIVAQEAPSIIPTEDPGPRFVEPLALSPTPTPTPAFAHPPTPVANRRNIPKFSRLK